MKIPGRKMLRRRLWQLRGRLFGGGVVLGYHRVADDAFDPWDLCVGTAHFQAQMEVLRRDFHVVPLARLAQEIAGRPARDRLPVAVTFDDGYADVLHAALPVLQRLEVPATVFVVVQGLGETFWWDRLQRILEPGVRLPPRLELREDGVAVAWSSESGSGRLRRELHAALRSVDPAGRERLLAVLEDWATGAGAPLPAVLAPLSAEQVRALGAHPLIEIGSHGATHTELPGLDPAALQRESRGSREQLEALVGKRVESFSYPHGVLDVATRDGVAAAGYLRACASWNGLVIDRSDPFRLPRLWPSRQPADSFRNWLRGWTGH